MTKKIFFGLAFAALLTACTDDYKDWVSPEKVAQPEQVSFADGSVSAVDVIKMADLVDGQTMVKVCNLTAPPASVSGYTPIYSISLNGQEFALGTRNVLNFSRDRFGEKDQAWYELIRQAVLETRHLPRCIG